MTGMRNGKKCALGDHLLGVFLTSEESEIRHCGVVEEKGHNYNFFFGKVTCENVFTFFLTIHQCELSDIFHGIEVIGKFLFLPTCPLWSRQCFLCFICVLINVYTKRIEKEQVIGEPGKKRGSILLKFVRIKSNWNHCHVIWFNKKKWFSYLDVVKNHCQDWFCQCHCISKGDIYTNYFVKNGYKSLFAVTRQIVAVSLKKLNKVAFCIHFRVKQCEVHSCGKKSDRPTLIFVLCYGKQTYFFYALGMSPGKNVEVICTFLSGGEKASKMIIAGRRISKDFLDSWNSITWMRKMELAPALYRKYILCQIWCLRWSRWNWNRDYYREACGHDDHQITRLKQKCEVANTLKL